MLSTLYRLKKSDMVVVTEELISYNKRWVMPHDVFLTIAPDCEKDFWQTQFKRSDLPILHENGEWTSLKGARHPIEVLWESIPKYVFNVRSADNQKEMEIEETSIVIWPLPDKEDESRITQDRHNPAEAYRVLSQEHLHRDFSKLIPNVGLHISAWPLLELGDLFMTPSILTAPVLRIRSEARMSDERYETQHRLVAICSTVALEHVQDISRICSHQGGKHPDQHSGCKETEAFFSRISALVSTKIDDVLPINGKSACSRTLILD